MADKLDYSYHYQKWYKETPEIFKKTNQHYKKLFSPFLPHNKNIRILDVGCGAGLAIMSLKNLGFENIEGLEIDAGQAQLAQMKGLNVYHTQNTPKFLESKRENYDVIICSDVIEHIPVSEHITFLTAIRTALKAKGLFICSTPNANSTIAGRFRYVDWTHTCGFTETSLDFLLHNCGFKNISIYPSDPFIPKKPWYHFLIAKMARAFRRLEMVAELGDEGWVIPLSVNIISVSYKNDKSNLNKPIL